jgi:2-methylaconitate cis-trans-isomerase PrpF
MGSPDSYGRQLNGMGGGISSTSKICVISRSERDDADVDFTFVQVGIRDGGLDVAGNCGNMSSVVGPVAWDEGLVDVAKKEEEGGMGKGGDAGMEGGEGKVRIWNTNTRKIIHSRFRVDEQGRYHDGGEYAMDGVPGTGSRITLSFLRPAGAGTGKGALPTGRPIDELVLRDGRTVEASLVDVSNPGVFVRAQDLMQGRYEACTTPAAVEADEGFKELLEEVRRAGAEKMGLDPDVQSVPKIVMLFDPSEGGSGEDADFDIRCLAMSMGQAHKAVPLTLALCLGAAAGIGGTIPYRLRSGARDEVKVHEEGPDGSRTTTIVIGHPSGRVEIGATIKNGEVISADLHRTARVLMKGEVFY